MIDIHTHVLHGVDDGARSFDESIEMCKLAASDGVEVMVATPHADDGVHETGNRSTLKAKVDELNIQLGGGPQVLLGAEIRFTHAVVDHLCVKQSTPTIADGPYALIEFPHAVVPVGSERAIFELMSNSIRPIIAHPERNLSLIEQPDRLYHLVEMGVLGQVDAGSVTGQFGKRVADAAFLMLDHGLIHVMASDCHNTRNRVPGLSNAFRAVVAAVGDTFAGALVKENPAAVIEGRPIPFRPAATEPTKKRKRWFLFGR